LLSGKQQEVYKQDAYFRKRINFEANTLFMDEQIHFYTALRCRMLDSLSTTLAHEHWVVMQGVTGSGKSTLARGAITHWPNRALTMSPLNRKGYQWEWTDDC
jgi:ABC-type uncharacterized transport system fused permease/ATPase subunit